MPAAVLKTADVCYLAPELVLLYKSTAAGKAEYQMDFDSAYPHMNEEQTGWLMNALRTMNPDGHKWLEKAYRPQTLCPGERPGVPDECVIWF